MSEKQDIDKKAHELFNSLPPSSPAITSQSANAPYDPTAKVASITVVPDNDDPVVIPSLPEQDTPDVFEVKGDMQIGECRFGVTCTGEPVGRSHWLADSSVCGDLVMALPSSVLIAARTKEGSGVAVDMLVFLDSVIEGAARLCGIPGITEGGSLPGWAVARLMGTFPALMAVYHEAMDQAVLTVEAATMKAAIGMKVTNKRTMKKTDKEGKVIQEHEETLVKEIAPDSALSKFVLMNRMKGRYNDSGDVKQAVQINLYGAEADL